MATSRVHKLGFPGPCIAYLSNCQEFEANYGQFVRKIEFFGVFLQENLTFLTLMYLPTLERLSSEKHMMKAGLIDENNVYISNI